MNWKDIKGVIGKSVPLLGSLLGGSAGETAGSLIASALGCEAEPDVIADQLASDPEAYLKLQELELSHKEELQKLQLQEAGMYLADRQSARSREIETTKATGKRDWSLYALAGLFIAGFFILMGFLIFRHIEESTVLTMVIGTLVSGVTMILQYFFGSSKSSSEKNSMLLKK